MPNWCDNVLEIRGGTEEDRQVFIAAAHDKDNAQVLSMERFLPTPPYYLDERILAMGRDEAYDVEREMWYDWRIAHWGTKWDIGDATFDSGAQGTAFENVPRYFFGTAWAPPTEWLRHVGPYFPKLTFVLRFVEEGMDYAGYMVVQDTAVFAEDFAPADLRDGSIDWDSDDWEPLLCSDVPVPDSLLAGAGA